MSSMYRQSMVGRVLRRALGMCPFLKRVGAAVEHILFLRTGQVRVEGHVEGEVDRMARDVRIRALERAFRLRRSVAEGEVRLGKVWARHAEAHRGRHLLPAVPGLAGEVGDFVHGGRAREGGDRATASLEGLEVVVGLAERAEGGGCRVSGGGESECGKNEMRDEMGKQATPAEREAKKGLKGTGEG